MQTTNINQEAHRLIEQLPENATWGDSMYESYVRCGKRLRPSLEIAKRVTRWMSKRSACSTPGRDTTP
jgi:hypothetical protein